MKLRGNAAIAHGGGPTAVLNASLAGVCDAWMRYCEDDELLGARFGFGGILENDFVKLNELQACVQAGAMAPGSIIGSSRQALSDEDYARVLKVFRERGIHCFFYTGGNGSMETAQRLAQIARERGHELQVIGIPKTIDNDLAETDHTPGYASAARFFIHAARDVGLDNRALPSPVCVLEVLGRNTGWIAAATSLARGNGGDDAPHLIYFPERPVSLERMAADVERVYRRIGRVVIAVCEGQLDDKGQPFGADVDRADSAVHRLASNLGHTLAQALSQKTGLRARAEKPGLMGRSCAALASEVDRKEAFLCGRAAVKAAVNGETEKMVTLERAANEPYECETGLTDLKNVARRERTVPREWISSEGNDVADGFRKYLLPLVGKIEYFAGLGG